MLTLRWAGKEGRSSLEILTRKPSGKSPRRPSRRWKDNIRMDIINRCQIRLIRLRIEFIVEPL